MFVFAATILRRIGQAISVMATRGPAGQHFPFADRTASASYWANHDSDGLFPVREGELCVSGTRIRVSLDEVVAQLDRVQQKR